MFCALDALVKHWIACKSKTADLRSSSHISRAKHDGFFVPVNSVRSLREVHSPHPGTSSSAGDTEALPRMGTTVAVPTMQKFVVNSKEFAFLEIPAYESRNG